jgi:hypothetical protein
MSNMDLVGYNDLQARSAYQPVMEKQGSRWIAYIGHHGGSAVNPLNGEMETNGTIILDVADPKKPKYLFHTPGEMEGGHQEAEVLNPEAPKWCTYARGANCPTATRTNSICFATLGTWPTKCGT